MDQNEKVTVLSPIKYFDIAHYILLLGLSSLGITVALWKFKSRDKRVSMKCLKVIIVEKYFISCKYDYDTWLCFLPTGSISKFCLCSFPRYKN